MWHEARRSEKKVHGMMDVAKKRAEKRAIFLSKKRGDPMQNMRIVGSSCRLHHDINVYQSVEQLQGMIPWNDKEDNLIDRFDGRSLLDFIREYDPRRFPAREKTEEEEELEDRANFERFRDLIKIRRKGLTDEEGLMEIDEELDARSRAPPDTTIPGKAEKAPGQYARIGYRYDAVPGSDDRLDASDDGNDEEEDEKLSSEDSEDEEVVRIGQSYGIHDFNRMIFLERKARDEERRIREWANGDPTAKKLSRKERRKLARTGKERDYDAMAKGLQSNTFRSGSRRSPAYDSYPRPDRSRVPERSLSPPSRAVRGDREPGSRKRYSGSKKRGSHGEEEDEEEEDQRPRIEFITEFGVSEPANREGPAVISPWASSYSQAPILEAIRGDPALSSFHPVSSTAGETRDRTRPGSTSKPGSSSSTVSKLTKGLNPGTPSKAGKKETPQERLKRIMSMQLDKQIKKDTAQETAKKLQQEREQQERAFPVPVGRSRARSRSWTPSRRSRSRQTSSSSSRSSRSRSRSSSRSRHRSRSKSRSRSRSRGRSKGRSRSRSPPKRSRRYRNRSRSWSRSRSRSRSRSSDRGQYRRRRQM